MENIKSVLTLPTKVWGAIALTGSIVLLSEPVASQYYGGTALYHRFGIWVFLITILAFSFLLIAVGSVWWENHKFRVAIRRAIKFINNTNAEEKEIIRKLYEKPDHVVVLRSRAQQVIELENRFVITKATTQQAIYDFDQLNDPRWPYLLQPWVIQAIDNKKIVL